jgi:hypothetical protein
MKKRPIHNVIVIDDEEENDDSSSKAQQPRKRVKSSLMDCTMLPSDVITFILSFREYLEIDDRTVPFNQYFGKFPNGSTCCLHVNLQIDHKNYLNNETCRQLLSFCERLKLNYAIGTSSMNVIAKNAHVLKTLAVYPQIVESDTLMESILSKPLIKYKLTYLDISLSEEWEFPTSILVIQSLRTLCVTFDSEDEDESNDCDTNLLLLLQMNWLITLSLKDARVQRKTMKQFLQQVTVHHLELKNIIVDEGDIVLDGIQNNQHIRRLYLEMPSHPLTKYDLKCLNGTNKIHTLILNFNGDEYLDCLNSLAKKNTTIKTLAFLGTVHWNSLSKMQNITRLYYKQSEFAPLYNKVLKDLVNLQEIVIWEKEDTYNFSDDEDSDEEQVLSSILHRPDQNDVPIRFEKKCPLPICVEDE